MEMAGINKKARILIVDDEEGIRDALFEFFELKFDCAMAASAEEALELLRSGSFQLVISDIRMPGMNGLEMIEHVHRISPDTVTVMISGNQNIESAIDALRGGAFDYILKPFNLIQIDSIAQRALEYYAHREAKRLYDHELENLVRQRTAELKDALASVDNAYRSTLMALAAALETRDRETHGHSKRVVKFSLRLGRECGLSEKQLRDLEFGALLHDIGKIGVPDAILRKPAALNADEWKQMREHPRFGEEILRGIDFLAGAARVVGQHHEKWDGTGYPRNLKGSEIDINARIFTVADAFDALTSNRVYRAGRTYQAALEELDKWSGKQFDPQVIEAFHRISPEEWEELRHQPVGENAGPKPHLEIEAHEELAAAKWLPTETSTYSHLLLRHIEKGLINSEALLSAPV
jgi:putative two-component system response regulator